MTTKQEKIRQVLGDFVNRASSIQAAAVMSRDGVPIASKLEEEVNDERLSAISASLLSLADRAAKDLKQGELEQVLIDSADGFLLMVKVGENAVLAVVSSQKSRLGMLLVEAKKSAAIISEYIK